MVPPNRPLCPTWHMVLFHETEQTLWICCCQKLLGVWMVEMDKLLFFTCCKSPLPRTLQGVFWKMKTLHPSPCLRQQMFLPLWHDTINLSEGRTERATLEGNKRIGLFPRSCAVADGDNDTFSLPHWPAGETRFSILTPPSPFPPCT